MHSLNQLFSSRRPDISNAAAQYVSGMDSLQNEVENEHDAFLLDPGMGPMIYLKRKHGVSFEEAQTAFSDERGLLIHDPDHSDDDDRFVLLGLSSSSRALVVCHCFRREANVIRIISARKADRREQQTYSQRWTS